MKCPKCGFSEDKVIDSRLARDESSIRRRRECQSCQFRFSTLEAIVPAELYVIKRDKSREEFDPKKIRRGIEMACYKRPVREEQIDDLIQKIVAKLEGLGKSEIPSVELGHVVMEQMKDLDEVAYVRFASVYRQFKDLDQFISEIRSLNKDEK